MISLAETQLYMNQVQGPMAAAFKALTGIDVSLEWHASAEMKQKIIMHLTPKTRFCDIIETRDYANFANYRDNERPSSS
jgi:hypothetical protein